MVSTHGYVSAEPPLGAADTGGQVVYVIELSRKLAQLGYEVDIWTRQFEGQPACDDVSPGVRVLRVPCGGPEFIPKEHLYQSLLEWSENALRLITRQRLAYDFVSSHYWDAGFAAQRLCEALQVPHVHTPHSLGIWKHRQMLTDFPDDAESFDDTFNFSKRIRHERQIYRAADLVVATTPVQTDMLRKDYELPAEKIRMIPPGYDDNRFFPVGEPSRAALRQKFGFTGKTVLSLGRLATNKGYDLLIQAFAEVAKREPAARLRLAVGGEKLDPGEQQIMDELQALTASLNLTERVSFAGFVAEADLADTYRAADVFVLPSRYEPFGMTAIEAMACGTPTVVTTHGGLYRVLKFGVDGLFANAFDASDLAITLLKPLQFPMLAERLSRNGAHLARSLFTWSGVAQQLIATVEDRTAPRLSVAELEPTDNWFGPTDQS